MKSTIDGAGRVVIPKAIRDRMGLTGGEALEVDEERGTIRIIRAQRAATLTDGGHGILTAELDPPIGEVDAETVREVLERTRR